MLNIPSACHSNAIPSAPNEFWLFLFQWYFPYCAAAHQPNQLKLYGCDYIDKQQTYDEQNNILKKLKLFFL